MTTLKIKEKTVYEDDHKEIVISVNNYPIVHVVYKKHQKTPSDNGFKVVSYVAEENAKIVGAGSSWEDVRSKARKYAKENFFRHVKFHNIKN